VIEGISFEIMPSLHKGSRIAIVGGGVGGLTLANLLQQQGFEKITVLEKWQEVKTRGGHISIMPESLGGALPVMEVLGFKEKLAEFVAPSGNLKMLSNGRVLRDITIPMGPRIMREALQQMLLEKLKPGTVHFGKTVSSFSEHSDRVKLLLDDGTAESFDLAVACDGINSTMAAQLFPDFGKKFSGFVSYVCLAHGEFLPDAIYGHHVFGDGRGANFGGIQGYGLDGRWDMVGFTVRSDVPTSNDWDSEGTKEEIEQLFEFMQKHSGDCPSSVRTVVEKSDRIMRWGIYEHEPKPTWISPGGKVALLGDAAHAMAPYLGQGAQSAMLDAHALATEICQDQPLAKALQAYETRRKPICERIVASANFRGLGITSCGIAASYHTATGEFMRKLQSGVLQHPKAYVRKLAGVLLRVLEFGYLAAERMNVFFAVA